MLSRVSVPFGVSHHPKEKMGNPCPGRAIRVPLVLWLPQGDQQPSTTIPSCGRALYPAAQVHEKSAPDFPLGTVFTTALKRQLSNFAIV